MTDTERFQGKPRDSVDFSGLSPMQVVGRFVFARMEGKELSAQDVARNTGLAEEDVTKLREGSLDFVTLMDSISAVEKYLDFDLDLQKLLIRLSTREMGNQFRAWGRGE